MSRLPVPTRKVKDVESIFEDLSDITRESYESTLEELTDAGFLVRGYDDNEDRMTYCARDGLSWSEVSNLDCPVKKQVLLCLIDNPQTFFVLYNTQKGKSAIVSKEIREWASVAERKVVAFLVVDNDKTLADQTSGGMSQVLNEVAPIAKVFPLSSNSTEVTLEGIRTHIDAYAADQDGEYQMPVIVALNNATQIKKILALMNHIKTKVETRRSSLRYGVVFDEADKVYPTIRGKDYAVGAGQATSFATLLVNNQSALHRLGFVTATEGDLMDAEYPECANAYMYPVSGGDENYRAFHTEGAVIKDVRHLIKDSNDVYAEKILEEHAAYFSQAIVLPNSTETYRKVIVNGGAKTASMETFALRRVASGAYAITVNMLGINVYRPGFEKVRRSTKGVRFGHLLFTLYTELGLHDKPLFIIGRRKVDRGLGFHYAPRDGSNGLVWTDMILGRVDDKDTAVQKAGRLAGIVAQCPQYPGTLTWWTDAGTAAVVSRHNSVVDGTNALRGCSALQAMTRAESAQSDGGSSQGERSRFDDEDFTAEWSPVFATFNEAKAEGAGALRVGADGFYRNRTGRKGPMTVEQFHAVREGKKTAHCAVPNGFTDYPLNRPTNATFAFYENPTDPSTVRFAIKTLTRVRARV